MSKEEKKVGHTPGPWSIEGIEIMAGDWKVIAQMRGEINIQDARLMAEAPVLLAALKEALKLIDIIYIAEDARASMLMVERQRIESVIEKAEGK
jgi:hypothetical protein